MEADGSDDRGEITGCEQRRMSGLTNVRRYGWIQQGESLAAAKFFDLIIAVTLIGHARF